MIYSGDDLSIFMKSILNFLLKVNKLKITPRTGWILRGVKNPETIAEHTFRMTIAAWLLGEKKNLNIEKTIKYAFSHDLCEVYAGDVTPFFYYINLPKDKEKREKILMKWVRLSKKEKEKRGKKKYEIERKSLLKLIKLLNPKLKKEILSCWLYYEKGITKEGKFIRPVDKIETLMQAIEYFGSGKDTPVTGWWEETEELVEEPLLKKSLRVIQKRFYEKKPKLSHEEQELEAILDFLLEIGKLKSMPRKIWRLLEIENPETVASHIFTVVLMAWIFGHTKKELNMEKLLKMSLCHEIPAIYTDDLTPYDRVLSKDKKGKKEVFKKWLRLSTKEKKKYFFESYREEREALQQLTKRLLTTTKEEIMQLFDEYKTTSTAEARFLNQINVLAVLLQALQYQEKDKDLSIDFLWEWAFEKCENSLSLGFIEELKKRFYGKRFIYKFLHSFTLKRKSNKK